MQLQNNKNSYEVSAYGMVDVNQGDIIKGTIVNYENVASAIKNLFENKLVGEITTNRVALSVPSAFTYSRIINLPKSIQPKDTADAVLNEIQQYLPLTINELYMDYSIIGTQKDENRILTVATSRKIVDSYMNLAQMLGLEVVAVEPTTDASNRLFGFTDKHKVPTVLIDFGQTSTDITVYDNDLVVTGTVNGGGDQYTQAIKTALNVNDIEAQTIKIKYGLNVSKKQQEIRNAIKPYIEQLIKEIKRMTRYYEERVADQKKVIGQVVTLGEGANLPGLTDLLTEMIRLPVRQYDPWNAISFGKLKPPQLGKETSYISVAGLGLINPKEIYS
jgi:type IV pilus assembly protein PilM